MNAKENPPQDLNLYATLFSCPTSSPHLWDDGDEDPEHHEPEPVLADEVGVPAQRVQVVDVVGKLAQHVRHGGGCFVVVL